ncbi:MAG: hypothetical protein ACRDNT_30105 [Streptosporangiaceae bacterium]
MSEDETREARIAALRGELTELTTLRVKGSARRIREILAEMRELDPSLRYGVVTAALPLGNYTGLAFLDSLANGTPAPETTSFMAPNQP